MTLIFIIIFCVEMIVRYSTKQTEPVSLSSHWRLKIFYALLALAILDHVFQTTILSERYSIS